MLLSIYKHFIKAKNDSFKPEENKSRIDIITKSPLISENSFTKKSSSFKKSKSMQITSNKAHSTPKTTLSKEFEHLQDDDCENSIQIDSPLVVKTNDNYDTKPCKLSPIVNSNSQGILRNNKSLQQITLSQEAKKCVRFNSNHQLDNINRNLEFDDEDSNDKHPEKVNEDDSDLLEHLYQLEKCKKNVGQTEVSYNDDDDSNQTLVFDKSKTIDSNDIKIGFKTASEKSISINKSAFFNSKALDIIKESEDNDQNSFKKDIEMKSDNIKSDFVFANNKSYLISKSAINKVSNIDEEDEDIKGDIEVKKEISIKNDDQINKSIQVISTNEKKLNNNNRKSIDPPNMSINQSANFLDNTSFLNSSKLNLSVNVSNKNATFEKRKSFTRVICYSKPKETITSIDESKKEEVEICMENLPKISESQETNSRPSSYTSNESTNSYVFSAEPNAPIIKLKDIRIEKSDNGMFIVKPSFELINLDSK